MKKLWNVFLAMWRTMLLGVIGIGAILLLMLMQLQSLTPGITTAEQATLESASSISDIINNPVQAPYKTAVFISTSVFDSVFGLRLVGALVGALTVGLFFAAARRLYSPLVALATTVMFSTSTFFLMMTRTATPSVMLLSLFAVVGVGYFIRFHSRKDIGWILAAIILGLSLYVPGMILFIVPAAIWQLPQIRKTIERLQPPIIIAASVLFGILCVPILVSLIREPSLWQAYLGLPEDFSSLSEIARSSGTALTSLFVMSPFNPAFWLGRQPILDIFATTMFLYGIISLIQRFRLDRFWIIVGVFLLGLLWIGITANWQGLILLLPFVYIVIGFGTQKLINEWLAVFPRNPIARYTGAALLAIVIVSAINFQLHRYFVAWPNSDATKQVFIEPRTEEARQ